MPHKTRAFLRADFATLLKFARAPREKTLRTTRALARRAILAAGVAPRSKHGRRMGGLLVFLALAFHIVGCGAFIYSLPLTLPETPPTSVSPVVSLSEGAMFASGPFGASGPASISVSMTASAVSSPQTGSYNLFLAFADEAGAASLGKPSSSDGRIDYCNDGNLMYTAVLGSGASQAFCAAWALPAACAHFAAYLVLSPTRRHCAAANLQRRRLFWRADGQQRVRAGAEYPRASADAHGHAGRQVYRGGHGPAKGAHCRLQHGGWRLRHEPASVCDVYQLVRLPARPGVWPAALLGHPVCPLPRAGAHLRRGRAVRAQAPHPAAGAGVGRGGARGRAPPDAQARARERNPRPPIRRAPLPPRRRPLSLAPS